MTPAELFVLMEPLEQRGNGLTRSQSAELYEELVEQGHLPRNE